MGRQVIDLQGQRFGRWTVLSLALRTGPGQSRWLCRCDCGTEAVVASDGLRKGRSRSCGCSKREPGSNGKVTHGHSVGNHSLTYRTWAGMKSRCTNPNEDNYHRYGGRGIRYCDRWEEFENFLADMGVKPRGMSL